jgi:hypothetical protein
VFALLAAGSITWPHVDSDCARINTLSGLEKQTHAPCCTQINGPQIELCSREGWAGGRAVPRKR